MTKYFMKIENGIGRRRKSRTVEAGRAGSATADGRRIVVATMPARLWFG